MEDKISRTIFLLNSSSGNNYSLVQKLDDLEDQRDELMFELDELTEFNTDFEEVVSRPLLLNQKKIIS